MWSYTPLLLRTFPSMVLNEARTTLPSHLHITKDLRREDSTPVLYSGGIRFKLDPKTSSSDYYL
jgi:hypothetical protein